MNHCAKYLCQRSFRSTVRYSANTHTDTQTHVADRLHNLVRHYIIFVFMSSHNAAYRVYQLMPDILMVQTCRTKEIRYR